jgi:hypothetical protein
MTFVLAMLKTEIWLPQNYNIYKVSSVVEN